LNLKYVNRLYIFRGSFEWDGDWSDKSDLWNKHPTVKLEMGFTSLAEGINFSVGKEARDDGIFYMSWNDFLKYFDGVDVCVLSNDLDDIEMDLKEDYGIFGPILGCIIGKHISFCNCYYDVLLYNFVLSSSRKHNGPIF
jgi:hypothetical protein